MNAINVNTPINSMGDKVIKKKSNNVENNINPLDLQKNFLSLLVAQIKNQDPTDPIKNHDLTSQLAQINTASGIERLNHTVSNLSTQINNNKNIQLSSLIGHHILIPNNQIIHTKDTKTKCSIELMGNATSVQIKISDKNNKILHLEEMNDLQAGIHSFLWDGKDLDKNSMMTGKYNISVIAKNKDQHIPVQTLSETLVNSIIMSADDPILDLGVAGNIMFSKIRAILQ